MLAAEDSCFDLVGPRQHGTANNRPFATSDHMVQVMIFWMAKECDRLQNNTQLTRKV